MSLPATYKPSPLSFRSPRTSPFRRPESPASPSTVVRPTTPTHISTRPTTPSKLRETSSPQPLEEAWTPKGHNLLAVRPREPPTSPTRGADGRTGELGGKNDLSAIMAASIHNKAPPSPAQAGSKAEPTPTHTPPPSSKPMNADALSRLPPAQVREMREAYQILDRDADGRVTRDDVVEMLSSLGLDASPPALTPFFPPTSPTLSLPSYLSTLSSLLSELSPPAELLAAFDAFDDDDSGQVGVAELRAALMQTSPEAGERGLSEREVERAMEGWVGRRAFAKGLGGKGEVFRYREWVAGLGSVGEGVK